MKQIFKFFPVALAAFALASCSSDDLNVTNADGEIQNVDGKLLVQVDGQNEDVTRSGFMTTVNPTSSMLRSSLFFSKNDQLKLYHEATSWKPEVWTATDFGQYKNSTGAASSEEGSVAVFDNANATITEAEKAYGIFPATIGQFGNENRTSLKYDLSALKFISYSAEAKDYDDGTVAVTAASDATGNTKAYTAPFPLWGVKNAGAKVMTMKHLAGILRLDLANVDNSSMTATQARYIVIQSVNKLTGDLATAADVFNPTATEEVDPETLMTKAPKLVTTTASGTTGLTAVPTTATGITNDDVIVVELTKDDPNHVMLFLPITAGNGETSSTPDIKIYVSTPVTKGSSTTLALGTGASNQAKMGDGTTDAIYELTADLIDSENKAQLSGYSSLSAAEKKKVQPGVFYRINDDSSNQNTTAKTPWELAQGIIDADKAAYRDFEINFTLPIQVKNEDTAPQNFYLDLSGENTEYGLGGYDLKHNVTVNFTLAKSSDATTKPAVLYIKTKSAASKKLTLNITNATSAIDSIVVLEDELRSNLVLKEATGTAQLPKIHINKGNNDKVTLEAGTTQMITGSDVAVDNASGQTVDEIVLANGISKLNLLDGQVSKLELAAGSAPTDPKPIAADVTIYTEGNAAIKEVNYGWMPKTTTSGRTTDTYNLIYESKWIAGSVAPTAAATTAITGVSGVKYITSAAQLAGIGTATGDVTVLGTYDLDGTNSAWTSLTGLTQSITGAQYYRFSNSTASARAIEGKTTIKNLAGTNGLIADWTPAATNTIKNIIFDGGNNVTGATGGTKIGLLVGEVTTTNSGNITDIEVKGTNTIKSEGSSAAKAIAAVIGKASGADQLNLSNVTVAAGTTVKGFQYVGGLIGEIAGKVSFGVRAAAGTDKFAATTAPAYLATDVQMNASAASLETYRVNTTAPCSSALPTFGQFYGGISAMTADGDVTILVPNTTTDFQQLTEARTDDLWGYYVPTTSEEYDQWNIELNYNQFGHYGAQIGTNNVVEATATANKYAKFLHTTGGTTATYGLATPLKPYIGVVGTATTGYTKAKADQAWTTSSTTGVFYYSWVKQPR